MSGFGAHESVEAELRRSKAECAALRVTAEGAEVRLREAALRRRDAASGGERFRATDWGARLGSMTAPLDAPAGLV